MKIRTTTGNERTERNAQEALNLATKKKESATTAQGISSDATEKVNFSTTKQLQSMLDPEAFTAERAARVAELKKIIDGGTDNYFKDRPSSKIADKIGRSLSSEVNLINDLLSDSKDEA